jgi:ketosteroid isomerase-like protein
MSENLELVRSIIADWERGDFSHDEWAHPEIEYEIADGPTPGRWRGIAEMAQGAKALFDTWDDFHVVGAELREVHVNQVLVLPDVTGRGKTSGVEIHGQVAYLFDLRDGKVTRYVLYLDRDRALADLGLEE